MTQNNQELSTDQKLDRILEIQQKQCLEIDWVLRSIRLVMRAQQWPKELRPDVQHVVDAIDRLLEQRERDRQERLSQTSERPTDPPPMPIEKPA
jgi:hypothetical protein